MDTLVDAHVGLDPADDPPAQARRRDRGVELRDADDREPQLLDDRGCLRKHLGQLGDRVPEALRILLADDHGCAEDREALDQDAAVAHDLVEPVDHRPEGLLDVDHQQRGLVGTQQRRMACR